MNRDIQGSSKQIGKGMVKKALQVAALALMVALAMPGRAADERAVKSRVAPVYPELA
jgi:hypothetical protein